MIYKCKYVLAAAPHFNIRHKPLLVYLQLSRMFKCILIVIHANWISISCNDVNKLYFVANTLQWNSYHKERMQHWPMKCGLMKHNLCFVLAYVLWT